MDGTVKEKSCAFKSCVSKNRKGRKKGYKEGNNVRKEDSSLVGK
jgi:hypothetical protein